MTTWTAHLKPGRPPILVKEAFSWAALLFGPLWLLAHRAWIPAILLLALEAAVTRLPTLLATPTFLAPILLALLVVLTGILGRDLLRWSLARRRYALAHVVAARNTDEAYARLLSASSHLLGGAGASLPPSLPTPLASPPMASPP